VALGAKAGAYLPYDTLVPDYRAILFGEFRW